jgi:hypothetical protein
MQARPQDTGSSKNGNRLVFIYLRGLEEQNFCKTGCISFRTVPTNRVSDTERC